MDSEMNIKTKIILVATILSLLFVIIPLLQMIWLNDVIADIHINETGSSIVERNSKASINATSSYLIIFMFNFIVNIVDAFCISKLLTWALGYILTVEHYDMTTGIRTDNKTEVQWIIGIISFILLMIAFKDIYAAGMKMAFGFGHLLQNL